MLLISVSLDDCVSNDEMQCVCMVKMQQFEEVIKVKMSVWGIVFCSLGLMFGGLMDGVVLVICEEVLV